MYMLNAPALSSAVPITTQTAVAAVSFIVVPLAPRSLMTLNLIVAVPFRAFAA